MGGGYLSSIFRFAFRGAFLRTDQVSVFIGFLAPFAVVAAGPSVSDWLPTYLMAAGGLALAGIATLRLVTGPYFVWKEQRSEIDRLRAELASPRFIQQQKLAELMAQERVKLSEEIERIRMVVLFSEWTEDGIRTVFHGSERIASKFAYDESFERLWDTFYAT